MWTEPHRDADAITVISQVPRVVERSIQVCGAVEDRLLDLRVCTLRLRVDRDSVSFCVQQNLSRVTWPTVTFA